MAKTVVELSKMVGCSTATVSRAMNNSGAVSPKMREAVLKALRETQYVAQRGRRKVKMMGRESAQGLIEVVFHRHSPMESLSLDQAGMAVGPLAQMPHESRRVTQNSVFSGPYRLGNSFYRQVLDGVVAELDSSNFKAVLQINSDLMESKFLADMNEPNKRGLILIGEYHPDLARFVASCQHPLVLVDLIHDSWPDVVTIDNLTGVRAAFDHLYELGHRQIGFVGRQDHIAQMAERYTTYAWKMAEAGIAVKSEWIYAGPDHIEVTTQHVRQILSQADRPTAFVCANDCAALSVIRAASSLGLNIPGDLSVVGFDDIDAASLVTPALTTVRVPTVQMGRQAVRQLMTQIHSPEALRPRGCEVRVKTELVVRQSTGPCK